MIFRSFKVRVFFRVILLCLNVFFIFYFFFHQEFLATPGILLVLLILQVAELLRYVDRFSRSVTSLLNAINYDDFTISFHRKNIESDFRGLFDALNRVIEQFRKTRTDKEEKAHFLEYILDHISVAIVIFDKEGRIEVFNNAARILLRTKKPANIESFETLDAGFVEKLKNIRPDDFFTQQIKTENVSLHLAANTQIFRLGQRELRMVSLQNITSELEQKELEAWQNIIKVLTHEIMNSITPIISLAGTAHQILISEQGKEVSQESIDDLGQAIATIEKRSKGLLTFVEAYRNLTKLPKPNLHVIRIQELFETIQQLVKSRLQTDQITLIKKVEPVHLTLIADVELIEQVIINLLLNSIDALKETENPHLKMNAFLDERGRVIIQIEDNGQGVDPSMIDKIFIPFFTTKKEGTGVGLSLSKQIMHMHKGSIMINSVPGEKTVFSLRFNKF